MDKIYRDVIKKYCKNNNLTIKNFAKQVNIPESLFCLSQEKFKLRLVNLIKLESYIGDLEEFKLDVALKIKSIISNACYEYFDKDLISKDDYYKIYKIIKPYIINNYETKNKEKK